jgi:putative protease
VFEGDRFRGQEQGGRVYQVYVEGIDRTDEVAACAAELRFDHHGVDLGRLWVGQSIWKTDDPRLNARLRESFENAEPQRRVPLDIFVEAHAGARLVLRAQTSGSGGKSFEGATPRVFDGCDPEVELMSDEPLQVALKHPLTEQSREQFDRLERFTDCAVISDIQKPDGS